MTWALCSRSGEEVLGFVEPGFFTGTVLSTAFFKQLVELLEQLALLVGELHRRFHLHVAVQIPGAVGAHPLDTLATQPELLAAQEGWRFALIGALAGFDPNSLGTI